jgi:hypothetical protein
MDANSDCTETNMQPTAPPIEVGLFLLRGEEEMKKAIILALAAVLGLLLLVGCAAAEESVPVGGTVALLGSYGSYIDMYPTASSPLVANLMVPAGTKCDVLEGPRTVSDVTLWKLDCSWSVIMDTEGMGLWVWVDVTNFEVLD